MQESSEVFRAYQDLSGILALMARYILTIYRVLRAGVNTILYSMHRIRSLLAIESFGFFNGIVCFEASRWATPSHPDGASALDPTYLFVPTTEHPLE